MGGSVSFIDGHIDNVDRCVCCGKVIPEGRQVCFICGTEKQKKQTNYDRIRNMSVEELAKLLCYCSDCGNGRCYGNDLCKSGDGACNGLIKWLESEVDTK